MIKITHRISVWIVTALLIAIAIFAPMVFSRLEEEYYFELPYSDGESSKQSLTETRDSLVQQLGDTNSSIHHSNVHFNYNNETTEVFATWLDLNEEDIDSYSNLTCINNLLSGYDFNKYPFSATWLSFSAYRCYLYSHRTICRLNTIPFSDRDDSWYESFQKANQAYDLYSSALYNHSFSAFYEAEKIMSETEDNFHSLFVTERLMEIDPNGELSFDDTVTLEYFLTQIDRYQGMLETNLNDSGELPRILTEKERELFAEKIAILNYKFDHRQLFSESSYAAHTINAMSIKFGRYCMIILVLLIAGTSVSQELATGSIKSLIIAPVRRWKIFLAKLLSILTWFVLAAFLLTGISTLSTLLATHSPLPNYIYVSGGMIYRIPYFLYVIMSFFVECLPLLVYLLLAFMISCMSKNTGISVAISTGLVLGANLPSLLVNILGRKRWVDFLPSMNMNIVNLVFKHTDLMYNDYYTADEITGSLSNPLGFSLIYTAILIIILLYIAYDAFTRKDIQ